MSSLVPCMCWVPKGAAKEVPDKVELSKEELQKLIKEAQDQMREMEVSEKVKKGGKEEEEEEKMEGACANATVEEEYDMSHYSSSESEEEAKGEKMSGAGMGNSLAGLAYYGSNDSDPYITLKKTAPEDDEEEDFKILPADNVLAIGRAEDEFSSVEVYVFSEEDVHAHSHHEILLTSFPLALEWLDFDPDQPEKKGNYLAVGMMTPAIEVWDLDMVDGLEPVFTLGDPNFSTKASKKKSKKRTKHKKSMTDGGASGGGKEGGGGDSHIEAVLGLSWNRIVRNILASASADKTVRVWDLLGRKCVITIPHPDKVQCLQWHPYEPHLLVTGAFDKGVRLYDCRTSETAVRVWRVDGEVEKVLWNHLKPEQLLVSTEGHTVFCMDKNSGASLFQIHAHTDAITDLSLSCHVPGLLVTSSSDDTIKFWDIQDNKPVFLLSRDMFMGAVLCARFCVDAPYALAVGGSKNGFQVIDVSQLQPVAQRFHGRDLMVPVLPGGSTTGGGREGEASGVDRPGTATPGEKEDEEEEVEEGQSQPETMKVESGSEASPQVSSSHPRSRMEGVGRKKVKGKKLHKGKKRKH